MSNAARIVNEMLEDEPYHDDWQPQPFMLQWFRNFLSMQRDGSMWASPSSGLVYRIDKTRKTLTLVQGDPNDERGWHKKNIVTLGALGWTVLPAVAGTEQHFAENQEIDPKDYAIAAIKPKKVYYSIVFLQGDEAHEALDILDSMGELAAMEHLKAWDYGGESEHTPLQNAPWGEDDRTFRDKAGEGEEYIMSWNHSPGYIGLVRSKKYLYGLPH